MARFLTSLRARKLVEVHGLGRARWELCGALIFESDIIGLVIVPEAFETDFASVPRALPLAFMVFGDSAHASAVIHDYLISNIHDWAEAARVFHEAMQVEGVDHWRAEIMYKAVLSADPTKPPARSNEDVQ